MVYVLPTPSFSLSVVVLELLQPYAIVLLNVFVSTNVDATKITITVTED